MFSPGKETKKRTSSADPESATKRQRQDDVFAEPETPMQGQDDGGQDGEEMYDSDDGYDNICLSQTDNPTPMPAKLISVRESNATKREQLEPLKQRKSIHDPVHGQIVLDGLLVAVLDTAEFQRLGSIQQLGGCSYVYPSVTHTRKEHSIGVAHLASMMVKHLQEGQEELGIDEDDVKCVALAGLVHDIGHGPFSHMFEEFMHRIEKDKAGPKWEHEEMSGQLVRLLVEKNQIPVDRYFTRNAEEQIEFVIQLVKGLKATAKWPVGIGRPESKRFLFDIVSNARNGIDVDKLDYLVRDAMAAFGSAKPLDIERIIHSSRVVGSEVCFQMKVALEINEVYTLRAKMHRQVYQHRIANVAEAMITDLLEAAEGAFLLKARNGDAVTLSTAAQNPEDFVNLTDSVIEAIKLSTCPGLEKAEVLIQRLHKRLFYK